MEIKNRSELSEEITALILKKDFAKVKALMRSKYKVEQFCKLSLEELSAFLEILKDAIYKGQL